MFAIAPCMVGPAPFSRTAMPRGSCVGGIAGTPLARLVSLQRLWVASRVIVSRLPVCDTLSRFGYFGSSPRVLRWTGEYRCCWRALPLRFSDAERLLNCPRSPRSGGRDLDLVLERSGDIRARSTSLVWLAIRTLRPYLARDERTAEAHPTVWTERASNSADRCPSAGHAPRAPLRPAFRYPHVNGRRATWPIVWLIVSA